MRRSLYRYRTRNLPTNVKNVKEILAAFERTDVMEKYGVTVAGLPFFKTAFACEEFEYCIFASDAVISGIRDRIPPNVRNYLMDATFKICPFGTFNQILIIHVCYLEQVICLFFICFGR